MYRINVVNAIRSLYAGKSDGVDDICSDNLKHATDRFIYYIVSLFNPFKTRATYMSFMCHDQSDIYVVFNVVY